MQLSKKIKILELLHAELTNCSIYRIGLKQEFYVTRELITNTDLHTFVNIIKSTLDNMSHSINKSIEKTKGDIDATIK